MLYNSYISPFSLGIKLKFSHNFSMFKIVHADNMCPGVKFKFMAANFFINPQICTLTTSNGDRNVGNHSDFLSGDVYTSKAHVFHLYCLLSRITYIFPN